MQGPEHKILPFKGRREGRHPLLWVVTENNMVLPRARHGALCARAGARFRWTNRRAKR